MSDHEFERYLAILRGLLRLSTNRREEIAAELRDHLEERLAELLAQGVSRNQAIITALEEFGDAAGLAGEFLHVFRRQRRRWVMRMTVSSVAVCIALGFSIMAIWPDNQLARPMAQAVAQESGDPFVPESPLNETKSPKNAAADTFTDPPDPIQVQKADEAKIPIRDETEPTPEDNNKRTEQKLAKRMKVQYPQIALRDVLSHVAQKYEIDVFVNQKQLEDAQEKLEEAVELEFKSISGDMLLDLVLRGAGLNYTIQDGIVVVTTSDDLDSMLEVRVYNCRDLIALMHEHPGALPGEMGLGMSSMSGGMMGGAMPGPGMNPGGVRGAMPGLPPRAGMPAPASPAGMEGMSGPGAMGMGGMGFGMSGGMGMSSMGSGQVAEGQGIGAAQSGASIPDLDALIHVLTNTVMPDSWEEEGGPGTIEAYYGGLLIVNNNPQAHRKIDKLLKMMRDAAQQPPGSVVREK